MDSKTREEIRHVYSHSARRYELLLKIYRALGVNLEAWRSKAIAGLPPIPEPRILDVGTGTGSNFDSLIEKYPDYQEIVGVDYTPEMLARAKQRVTRNNWKDIRLVLEDAREMSNSLQDKFDLVVSTYSLSIIPDSLCVLDEIEFLLLREGYLLLLDCQKFTGLLRLFNPLAIFLSKQLGGNNQTYSVRVSDHAAERFRPIRRKLLYSGLFYEDLYTLPDS